MGEALRNYDVIEDGNVIHLVKPKPKKNRVSRKTEVYPYEVQDVKRLLDWFESKGQWTHYLALTFSCNMARRIGDTLSLRWENLYDPRTGRIRTDILEIKEDKTDKLANPHINSAVRNAIDKYIENTRCKPSKDGYQHFVFEQLTGTHRGNVLTPDAHLKALKKAGAELGIEYNIGTHSGRKFFGMMSRQLHPSDYDSMEILQTIYNHSDTKTTKHYIGLTRKKMDQYYDDLGNFFDEYVVGGKEYAVEADKPIVSLDTNDLRDVVRAAYEAGLANANVSSPLAHVDAINDIMSMVEALMK